MILAELEIWHSRPIAPTRRVALGDRSLPCEPPPGPGGILLAAVVASSIDALDEDSRPDLLRLTHQLEDGGRVPQPRLRHRFQEDRVGLTRSRHVLRSEGDELRFDLALDAGTPEQMVLGAVYAAGALPVGQRHGVMRSMRSAMTWAGPLGADFVARVTGFATAHDLGADAYRDPMGWALRVMRFDAAAPRRPGNGHDRDATPAGGRNGTTPAPDRTAVQRRFRELLRDAHPDHGGDAGDAAKRIAELTEARRILLGA